MTRLEPNLEQTSPELREKERGRIQEKISRWWTRYRTNGGKRIFKKLVNTCIKKAKTENKEVLEILILTKRSMDFSSERETKIIITPFIFFLICRIPHFRSKVIFKERCSLTDISLSRIFKLAKIHSLCGYKLKYNEIPSILGCLVSKNLSSTRPSNC